MEPSSTHELSPDPQRASFQLPAAESRKNTRIFVATFVAAIFASVIAVMAYVWAGRIPAQPGMLYVPEGNFLAGPNKKSIQLNAFFIDETEVNNADFVEFCRA